MKSMTLPITVMVLLAISSSLMVFTAFELQQLETITASVTTSVASSPEGVLPRGTPAIYGEELSISYDGVSPTDPKLADLTIAAMAQYDRSIQLTGDDLDRYINALYRIGNGISCEYCCGARSIIREDGSAACGCAHSYAMRGLAKYLITQHGDAFTDEEIVAELGKWKTLFFPTQMQTKAEVMKANGIEVTYVTLASNQYRNIEKGVAQAGQMVGGC